VSVTNLYTQHTVLTDTYSTAVDIRSHNLQSVLCRKNNRLIWLHCVTKKTPPTLLIVT